MLTLTKSHDATLTIDDEPVLVHVKRMTKGEAIVFERDFFRHGQPRGSAEPTDDDRAAARQFIEDSISAYITVAPGQILDDGREITSGEDVIRTFCTRGDVLAAFYQLVYSQNFLGKVQKQILSELPFLSPGSRVSTAGPNGDGHEPIAESAESSDSASPAGATAESNQTAADAPASSGTKVH